ncbi:MULTISPECIES: tetratricopeptide repeat-containing sensor histidine kinase [Clostridium]|uniref:tetratricopeptide repeat-containing sensor histidine kinase n=1 Tax=Clostridium TaxID=1485 RepID=UPI0018AAFE18|nr:MULTISPECIES: tetratricopeptide repeat-containing sensor histidine kinase [Clostridium]MDB1968159.1 ATP-binding protein [Clostridium tertium]MDU1276981.1 ATP-binding protein [Clostridium sp.]MDU1565875.1 ATP-binding protein [Clostridium sp.]MDU3523577.1 ATP-binding protein [Clostridium sp.]MDU7086670.1 ATP-binding protein [Clostridium sp.]
MLEKRIKDLEVKKKNNDTMNKAYSNAMNALEKVDDGSKSIEKVQTYHLKALINMNKVIIDDAMENLEGELIINNGNKICLGQMYAELTKIFLAKNNMNGYELHLMLAEKTLLSEKNNESLVDLYIHLANKFARNEKKSEGINLLKKALYILKNSKEYWVAEQYLKIGAIFSIELNDNELALELYNKGYKLAKKYNLKDTQVLLMYYIALGYTYIGKRRDAIELFNKIIKNNTKSLSLLHITTVYMELSTLYIDLNLNMYKINSMIHLIEENIKQMQIRIREQFEANLILIKCRYYIKINEKPNYILDELDKAKAIYEKYLDSFRFSNFDLYIEMLYGDIYYKLNEYERALYHYNNLINLSRKYGYRFIDKIYERLSKTYERGGNYKLAMEYLEKANSIMISYDNSKYRDKYAELYKNLEVLQESEKTKSEFFASISHEFKTPINVIYSSVQLLNLYKNKDDREFMGYYLKYKNNIKQNCLRSFKLIDNIIDASRINKGNYEANFNNINIVELVEKITNSITPYVEIKNIMVIFDTNIEELIIKCDVYMVERIILNLLSNAIKFTPKNGKIIVSVNDKENEVEIRVRDTGIGIPKEMKDKIFNKFTQVDKSLNRSKEGSGIGLSLVKSLVDLLNGKIYLNTEYENGSEFVLNLPKDKIVEEEWIDYKKEGYKLNVEKISVELSDIYDLYS